MEAPHALPHGDRQLLPHNGLGRVLGQLEIVDAGHDARQVVVGGERRFVRLAHHSERGVQALEACMLRERCVAEEVMAKYAPPMGSFGLPVMNCK